MRAWWAALTPAEKRAKTARRDPDRVREQHRRKQAKRSATGTPEQKMKMQARVAVSHAVARGKLVHGPCESEGPACSGRIEGHHDDYSKPLDVRWLCRRHHDEVHS